MPRRQPRNLGDDRDGSVTSAGANLMDMYLLKIGHYQGLSSSLKV